MEQIKDTKELKVRCPRCLKEFYYYSSSWRPFCCERCKLVDFGHWLQGKYAIPGEKVEQSGTEPETEKDSGPTTPPSDSENY